ncbi:MAG TPA: metalloregulator ArsR/SmtB family transcription factor [Vicinamibacterales bacterium]|nr:metalloregulator ArsR/SmtB family transcription factor [Vicinamibacterales bacterium]
MPAAIFEDLAALGDATRSRVLLALERQELTVSELCSVLQLPQSTVSRHLKTLSDSGWAASRRDGTSRYYTLALNGNGSHGRKLWSLVRDQIAGTPAAAQDARRLAAVLTRRRTASQAFFATSAGQWDRMRDELFGPGLSAQAMGSLLDPDWILGDLGCGTGQMTMALAPFVKRVIAVDGSGEMLQAAKRRLHGLENVELRKGDLESLPIDDESLDAAVVALVLHHVPDPARVLTEGARVLKTGGRILVVDMLPHDREDFRRQMGHVWLGFAEDQVTRWLEAAGFTRTRVVALAPLPQAKGPGLFVASGTRRSAAL